MSAVEVKSQIDECRSEGARRQIKVEEVIRRWTGPDRPKLETGRLISTYYQVQVDPETGEEHRSCAVCAQGDILRLCGWRDQGILNLGQKLADIEIANILGISVGHSILLRLVNDNGPGDPQDVFIQPEKYLGPKAILLLKLFKHIDGLGQLRRSFLTEDAQDGEILFDGKRFDERYERLYDKVCRDETNYETTREYLRNCLNSSTSMLSSWAKLAISACFEILLELPETPSLAYLGVPSIEALNAMPEPYDMSGYTLTQD